MPYCKKCSYFSEDEHPFFFGTWPCTCDKLGIGRNPDSDSCNKFIEMPAECEGAEGDAEK